MPRNEAFRIDMRAMGPIRCATARWTSGRAVIAAAMWEPDDEAVRAAFRSWQRWLEPVLRVEPRDRDALISMTFNTESGTNSAYFLSLREGVVDVESARIGRRPVYQRHGEEMTFTKRVGGTVAPRHTVLGSVDNTRLQKLRARLAFFVQRVRFDDALVVSVPAQAEVRQQIEAYHLATLPHQVLTRIPEHTEALEARMRPGAHPEVWAKADGDWTWVPSPMNWYRSPNGSFVHPRPTDA